MTSTVKKPWPLYFMALWSFFGIGGFLSSASRVIFSQHEHILPIASLTALAVPIVLVYFLVKFNRHALIVFAILAISLALFQLFNIASILLTEGYNPIILFMLYYVVPSIILSPFAISKKYRELSLQYELYQKQENMRRSALKALKR